jgi:hypothetical protein
VQRVVGSPDLPGGRLHSSFLDGLCRRGTHDGNGIHVRAGSHLAGSAHHARGPTSRAVGPGGIGTGLPAGGRSLVYVPSAGIRLGGATMALDQVEHEPGDRALKLTLRLASQSDSEVNLGRAGVHLGVRQGNTTTEADMRSIVASSVPSRPTVVFKDLPADFTLKGATLIVRDRSIEIVMKLDDRRANYPAALAR